MWADDISYNAFHSSADATALNEDASTTAVEGAAESVEYPLPPLPEPILPQVVAEQPLTAVYDIIRALRREVDDPNAQSYIEEMLRSDPKVLQAMITVLHQSGLLLRQKYQPDGAMTPESYPLPACAPPPLPPGASSWIASSGGVVSGTSGVSDTAARGSRMAVGSAGYTF